MITAPQHRCDLAPDFTIHSWEYSLASHQEGNTVSRNLYLVADDNSRGLDELYDRSAVRSI